MKPTESPTPNIALEELPKPKRRLYITVAKNHKTGKMETWIIQLKDPKALKLLLDLEELQLIRLVKKGIASEQKLSEKYTPDLS